jgi:starch phosphorylase
MLREYVTVFYHPAELEVGARLANGGAVARDLESWAHRLTGCWNGIRFGVFDVRAGNGGSQVSVEVFLNDIALEDVTVELFAVATTPKEHAARLPMSATGPLPGTSHGFLFRANVPMGRPVSDWTPRVIPVSKVASIPSELPLVTWLR